MQPLENRQPAESKSASSRRAIAVGVSLAVVGALAAWSWRPRLQGGWVPMVRIATPAPSCTMAPTVSFRTRDQKLIEVGQIRWCGASPTRLDVLHVGDDWFDIAGTLGSEVYLYTTPVSQSPDGMHLLFQTSRARVFRSDDGGATFNEVRVPEWSDQPTTRGHLGIGGDNFETLCVETEFPAGRFERLAYAWNNPDLSFPFWQRALDALSSSGSFDWVTRYESILSNDGGRTWSAHSLACPAGLGRYGY